MDRKCCEECFYFRKFYTLIRSGLQAQLWGICKQDMKIKDCGYCCSLFQKARSTPQTKQSILKNIFHLLACLNELKYALEKEQRKDD